MAHMTWTEYLQTKRAQEIEHNLAAEIQQEERNYQEYMAHCAQLPLTTAPADLVIAEVELDPRWPEPNFGYAY